MTYEKVISFLSHFKPWMAYLFLLRLLFSSAPNLSGTPQRGRFMALPRRGERSDQRGNAGGLAWTFSSCVRGAAVGRASLDGAVVDGAGDGEAVEPLHGGDGGGDGVRRAEGVCPQVTRGQVAVLLQPRLRKERTV